MTQKDLEKAKLISQKALVSQTDMNAVKTVSARQSDEKCCSVQCVQIWVGILNLSTLIYSLGPVLDTTLFILSFT